LAFVVLAQAGLCNPDERVLIIQQSFKQPEFPHNSPLIPALLLWVWDAHSSTVFRRGASFGMFFPLCLISSQVSPAVLRCCAEIRRSKEDTVELLPPCLTVYRSQSPVLQQSFARSLKQVSPDARWRRS
jgi:hypothetical protein